MYYFNRNNMTINFPHDIVFIDYSIGGTNHKDSSGVVRNEGYGMDLCWNPQTAKYII